MTIESSASSPTLSTSSGYLWPAFFVLGLPLLCGILFVISTFVSARHNVQVWRQEFQNAFDAQCPHLESSIRDGQGKVYLDAYLSEYAWEDGQLACYSNGATTNCTCRLGDGSEVSDPAPPGDTLK
jgi:hypothetical protein